MATLNGATWADGTGRMGAVGETPVLDRVGADPGSTLQPTETTRVMPITASIWELGLFQCN